MQLSLTPLPAASTSGPSLTTPTRLSRPIPESRHSFTIQISPNNILLLESMSGKKQELLWLKEQSWETYYLSGSSQGSIQLSVLTAFLILLDHQVKRINIFQKVMFFVIVIKVNQASLQTFLTFPSIENNFNQMTNKRFFVSGLLSFTAAQQQSTGLPSFIVVLS